VWRDLLVVKQLVHGVVFTTIMLWNQLFVSSVSSVECYVSRIQD
jgi:hypothetical protein